MYVIQYVVTAYNISSKYDIFCGAKRFHYTVGPVAIDGIRRPWHVHKKHTAYQTSYNSVNRVYAERHTIVVVAAKDGEDTAHSVISSECIARPRQVDLMTWPNLSQPPRHDQSSPARVLNQRPHCTQTSACLATAIN